MICLKCGTVNHDISTKCKTCHASLQTSSRTTHYSQVVFQSPLRQAQPSNIIAADKPAFSRGIKTERQSMDYTSTQNNTEQNLFDSTISPETEQKTQVRTRQSQVSRSRSKTKTISLLFLTLITLLSAVTALYLYVKPKNTDANFLFAEAEKTYNNQNYASALVMYRQFVEKFPGDHLIPLAQDRISAINNQFLLEKKKKEQQTEELLRQAKDAYSKQRFLKPENDNAIFYTSEVLKLEPANTSALELQALVVRYFEDKAETARKRGYAKTAISYYQDILVIMPNDSTVQAKIDALSSQKR